MAGTESAPSPRRLAVTERRAAETALAVSRAVADDPFGLLNAFGDDFNMASLNGFDEGAWPMGTSDWSSNVSGWLSDASAWPESAGIYPGSLAAEVAVRDDDAADDDELPLEDNSPAGCVQCGGVMHRGMNDLEYICSGCGLIVERDSAEPDDDDAPRSKPNTARLRLVGTNSNQLQPDLYRSSTGSTAATQNKIYEEYCTYRSRYIETGKRAMPLDACRLASDYYGDVQRQCVKRSQNKKAIMAACFYHACLELKFSPSKPEIAAFMQLPNKGIARGSNFVRKLVADGKMDVDVNVDPCLPEINTIFAHLNMESVQFKPLHDAVHAIVQIAVANNIGTSSILRSKVAGATYIVLRRCRDRDLVPKPPAIQEFCSGLIRKNTVERFTRQLEGYHSYFEPAFAAAGLNSGLHL